MPKIRSIHYIKRWVPKKLHLWNVQIISDQAITSNAGSLRSSVCERYKILRWSHNYKILSPLINKFHDWNVAMLNVRYQGGYGTKQRETHSRKVKGDWKPIDSEPINESSKSHILTRPLRQSSGSWQRACQKWPRGNHKLQSFQTIPINESSNPHIPKRLRILLGCCENHRKLFAVVST